MRLKSVKLAGFKSFVDPTTFEVPGHLVGVVGPNGCGKSNIMDAMRWVLGESRASELRGESMQDVIFNGSSDRKPSGRASVEMVFDNTDARLGGAWAAFAELSVKRVLTRDGQSTYLINNQAVRRKDVHDMFLGTGLGPRAYAMIGQGTVSRIIEARPEELRVFLEEAAGVSKYKERRRETEHRLADTRENLTRVEDILRELTAQISKLERQAEVARDYRELETERTLKQQMLWLVRRDEALAERGRLAAQLAAVAAQMEGELAAQREIEARLEETRAAHHVAGDAVHRAQGAYYAAQGEVTRLEGEIRFVADAQTQLRERLAGLQAQADASRERDQQAASALQDSDVDLAAAQDRSRDLRSVLEGVNAELPALEDTMREARNALDENRGAAARVAQQIQVVATRRHGVESALGRLRERESRLRDALDRLGEAPHAQLDALRAQLADAEALEEGAAARLAASDACWAEADARRGPSQESLRDALARASKVEARIQALTQLQERVRTQGRTVPWLQRHGLDRLKRLFQRLRIEPGWETAVESVLRERVQALEVGRLESVAALLAEQPPAKVGFYSTDRMFPDARAESPPGLVPLSTQVRSADPQVGGLLDEWLHGCFCAETPDSAIGTRDRLPAGGRFVTRAGHVVGRLGVQLYAMDTEGDGVLARQQELDNLVREHRALELIADEARASATRVEALAQAEKARVAADREAHSLAVRRAAALRLDTERCAQMVQRATADRSRLQAELAETTAEAEARGAQIDQEAAHFERLDLELAERQETVEAARAGWEQAETVLAEARDRRRDLERDEREAGFAVREIEARRHNLREQILQARGVIERSLGESEQLRRRLDELSDEAARAGLQDALGERLRAEQALAEARARLDALTARTRELDEDRLLRERAQEPLRARLTRLQLDEQAARLGADQYAEQIAQAQLDEPAVRAAFPQPPRPSWLQGEVTRLTGAIAALGAVNLAALDELAASRQRHDFLQAQSNDLNEAIGTLADAIRRIDRETRTLLQETFDTVNRHFGRLFPELFGGGEARLVLTGDEILDAGVTVVAQPPGKRNSSVHLLSGGEKALTAIALVFALFQLNPAPFCLLDEVDAPLDDANTERYCAMVRRMSAQTQFLFITHNKIAMELAQQLIGVTMQERGVSRIVAVDLEAAERFAEAA